MTPNKEFGLLSLHEDAMIAVVLANRPKPKTKLTRKRKRKARKLLKEASLARDLKPEYLGMANEFFGWEI